MIVLFMAVETSCGNNLLEAMVKRKRKERKGFVELCAGLRMES